MLPTSLDLGWASLEGVRFDGKWRMVMPSVPGVISQTIWDLSSGLHHLSRSWSQHSSTKLKCLFAVAVGQLEYGLLKLV